MKKEALKRKQRLSVLAANNDCVVTITELSRTGYSKQEIATAVTKGLWKHLDHGVYFLSAGKPTWRQQVRAALLAAGGDAQMAARTLAAWEGVDGATEGIIEIVVSHGHAGPKPKGVTVHRTRHVSKKRMYDGLPGTSPERLLIDYAAHVSTDLAERAVESVLSKGLTAERRIWRELATLPENVPGVRRLARIMELRPTGKAARSTLEIDTLNLIRKSDLPIPARNHDVWIDDEHFELDLAFPEAMKAVEVDSKRWHSTATQKAKDRHKQERCEAAGWSFVRVTSVDVYGRPEWVVEQIRDLLLTPGFAAADDADATGVGVSRRAEPPWRRPHPVEQPRTA
ncbi:MAG: hypothetical protein QOK28_2668 [Actinomycetota bacterium]